MSVGGKDELRMRGYTNPHAAARTHVGAHKHIRLHACADIEGTQTRARRAHASKHGHGRGQAHSSAETNSIKTSRF